jgi:pimeloyl-ACP methyl ester carboxylesterase
MPFITIKQDVVHYEVIGHGRPIIFLHGWLGSCCLWRETMDYLSSYFQTFALDFWGFGESGKNQKTFTVPDFVNMVGQFMENLGIDNALIVGHSMGGTVSLSFALQNPEKVSKVVVVGSPIVGSSLALMLKLAGYPCISTLVFNMMWALKLGIRVASPWITRDINWPEMINNDLSRTTQESFQDSIASLRSTDLRLQLIPNSFPVMGMYGNRDVIVHPNQGAILVNTIPGARIERFENSGHFIMLDEPKKFRSKLLDFLDSEN